MTLLSKEAALFFLLPDIWLENILVSAIIDLSILEFNEIFKVNLDLISTFFQKNLVNMEESIIDQKIRQIETRNVILELSNLDRH